MKIIEKAMEFLELGKKRQEKKRKKLEKVIAKLEAAREKAKRSYKSEHSRKRRAKACEEFRALSKLLKKSRARLRALGREA